MKSLLSSLLFILPVVAFLGTSNANAQAPEQAFQQALELQNSGQIKEAAEAYEKILQDYQTSAVVSDAQFRLGYTSYLLGNHDKALEYFRKILQPPAPALLQQLGQGLIPQALAAKATALPQSDPNRKKIFEEALKEFDVFIQKYPKSDEMESVQYGRALTLYNLERFDDAVATLRQNLQAFGRSESILDSQYLLALTLATQATKSAIDAKGGPIPADAAGQYDEAEKFLRDIVTKGTDVALANDAQFQIGEVLFNRASLSQPDARPPIFRDAIAAYREIRPKVDMVDAQKKRLAGILDRIRAAGKAGNADEIRRLQRLQEREQAKLASIEGRGDQVISGLIKVGQAFFQLQDHDASRVLLSRLQKFAETDDQKKPILYYITMSYATQGQIEKAIASYEAFNAAFKKDPIAFNLPLVMGVMYLQAQQAEKAISYFDQQVELYPDSPVTIDTLTQKAAALTGLGKHDDARQSFQKILDSKPRAEIAAAADFGLATIDKDTGKLPDAIKRFSEVAQKFPGSPQAEQGTFWVAQLTFQNGDPKSAVGLFDAFLKKYSESQLASSALFGMAQAQSQSGDTVAAIATFKQVGEKYPASEAAPYSYFQRASMHGSAGDAAAMVAAMQEFVDKYPKNPQVYFAYDAIGQNHINAGEMEPAIATYEKMVESSPDNPSAHMALLKVAQLWRQVAELQGRYLALNEEQRATWENGVQKSIAASEKLLEQYPESPSVALGLEALLADQKLLVSAKKTTGDEVEKYFRDLAGKFQDKPGTRNKILFALAAYLYEFDAPKAVALMDEAYAPDLVYAPSDIDLYGTALLNQKKYDKATEVYDKLAADYPNPPGVDPQQAPPQVMESQAITLYGKGKALQEQGKIAEAGKLFERLKALYPWSPKVLEASYGVAYSQFEEKKYDEALTALVQIIRATTATAELRANSMLLGGKIQEAQGNIDAAIDYYGKIATFYQGVPQAAAEGLWKAGELIETKQAPQLKDEAKKKVQLAKALKFYKDLVDKFPNSPHASKAQERIPALSGK